MSLLIRSGTIVTMNDAFEVLEGDVSISGGRIAAIHPTITTPHDRIVDANGGYVLPGFVQTHVHLCQTLFRGYADDLTLMDWLRLRVWPMEAAHRPATLRAAARLASVELLTSGTTTVLTMETVHDTDAVFEAVAETGIRATIGKCMMDFDAQVPRRLQELTRDSIDESLSIRKRWDGAAHGRLRAAFAPRFAVSCSRELLEAVAALSREHNALVHTHASESQDELAIVERMSGGLTNLRYLASVGLATPHLCAAHCVWVNADEQRLLAEHDVKVMHCPGSNLKLGSGLAPIVELRARGVTVSLGADGAACNNRLDMFEEMRLAAVLQATAGTCSPSICRRTDARPGGRHRVHRGRKTSRSHRRGPRSAASGHQSRSIFNTGLLRDGRRRADDDCRRRGAGERRRAGLPGSRRNRRHGSCGRPRVARARGMVTPCGIIPLAVSYGEC